MHGNNIPIVKVYRNAENALDCRILHTQSQNFSGGEIPVLGPRHQYPLGSPAFPLFLFYETTTGATVMLFFVACTEPYVNCKRGTCW